MRSHISLVVIVAFLFSTIPMPLHAQEGFEMPEHPYLAVMDLNMGPGLPENLGPALSQKINEVLIGSKKYVLIDRESIGVIMEEIARAQGGCFDESCAVEAGKQLSAHIMVTGKVTKLGPNECQVAVKMTDVARGNLMSVASTRCECTPGALTEAVENVAFDLIGVERTPGKLIIASNPAGGTVYVDGENVGTTPLDVSVKPGKHTIIISRKGYDNAEETLNVAPGVSMSLNVSLVKAKKKWYTTWWFYTTVGVLVAGGAAGAFAAGGSSGGTPIPSTGSITITGSGP